MRRILLVTDSFLRPERTGLDVYCDKLVYWLPRLAPDTEFVLVSLGEPDQQPSQFALNIRHQGLPISRRQFYWASLLGRQTPLQTFAQQYDLIHLLTPLPVTIARPLVVTVHDLSPLVIPQAYYWHHRALTRWTLHKLSNSQCQFSVVSQWTGNDLHTLMNIPERRIHCIYEGVSEDFYSPDDHQHIEQVVARYRLPERYFLFIGSTHKRKNLPVLLQAYRQFRNQDTTDTQLVIAGRMNYPGGTKIRQQLQQLGLEDHVFLPGYIAQSDLPAVLRRATALLYPSLYEGFGLPILEAMACGVPVIASCTGAVPEISGGNALLCDPSNVDCFMEAMLHICNDNALKADLVAKGSAWAARFSWETTAKTTLRLYDKMLSNFKTLVIR